MNKATCLICRSPARERIDGALIRGQSIRALATRHGLSRSTIAKHRKSCLPAREAQAVQTAAERHREGALGRLEERISEAKRIMREAKAKGNLAVWRQANVDLAALEEKFEALSRALLPKEKTREALEISFTTDDKVHVRVRPSVSPTAQEEALEAGEDDGPPSGRPDAAEPAGRANPPKPAAPRTPSRPLKAFGPEPACRDPRSNSEAADCEKEPKPDNREKWRIF
jgi:hypothetical protein